MTGIALAAGDYRLGIDPELGGSVARFDWRDAPLFRPTCGPSVLDTACFPLVPFANRIAYGAFAFDGWDVSLSPNFPGSDHPHPLHGVGWLRPWTVARADRGHAVLRLEQEAGEWPWRFAAEQVFALTGDGLRHSLSITNLSDTVMPAGLGFHPYFPRTAATRYHGLHHGEWRSGEDGLPVTLDRRERAIDWWHGAPAATRAVDTAYVGREGTLTLDWPDRGLELTITPDAALSCTHVFVPAGADFLCVEPVSHPPDALNLPDARPAMTRVAPGETFAVTVAYAAQALP